MFPPPPAIGHSEDRHDTAPAALQVPTGHLTAQQLAQLRHQLLRLRQRLDDEITRLENKTMRPERLRPGRRASASSGSMAAGHQEVWEQSLAMGAIANKRWLCREIDQALAQMSNQTYGLGIAEQEVIAVRRLAEAP